MLFLDTLGIILHSEEILAEHYPADARKKILKDIRAHTGKKRVELHEQVSGTFSKIEKLIQKAYPKSFYKPNKPDFSGYYSFLLWAPNYSEIDDGIIFEFENLPLPPYQRTGWWSLISSEDKGPKFGNQIQCKMMKAYTSPVRRLYPLCLRSVFINSNLVYDHQYGYWYHN